MDVATNHCSSRGPGLCHKPWSFDFPGEQYEALATYRIFGPDPPDREEGDAEQRRERSTAGIDLGEIHPAVSHDGTQTHILNGRLLRSKRQYQNKLKEHLSKRIDRTRKGSRRRKKLIASKKRQLKKLTHQIKDIEHQQTNRLISTLSQRGVQTVVIGDVRDIRQDLDVGSKTNQKLHQWSFGSIRHHLTYKAERLGMEVVLQEERHTSRTCPVCGHRRKSQPKGRVFHCPNPKCGWTGHRDGVGAMNIRYKYRGEFGIRHVVGAMAPPTGLRFWPQARVARESEKASELATAQKPLGF